MSLWERGLRPLPVLTPFSVEALGIFLIGQGFNLSAAGSGAYPVASRLFLYPLVLPRRYVAASYWWLNGAAVGGNVDVAVYDRLLNRLGHAGSTAQAGISALQAVSAGSLVLDPGLVYLGITVDNTTATFFRTAPTAGGIASRGALLLASSFPAPSSAAGASALTSAYVPVFGVTERSFL